MKKFMFSLILSLLFVQIYALADAREFNLVRNPGFEDGETNWSMFNGATTTTNEKYSGTQSAYLVVDTETSSSPYIMSADITVEPSTTYMLRAFVKMENVPSGGNGVSFIFHPGSINAQGDIAWGDMTGHLVKASGTSDWAEYNYQYTTDINTTRLRVYSYLVTGTACSAWIDDFSLVRDKNLVKNPGFEDGNWANMTGKASIDTTVKRSGAASLKLSNIDDSTSTSSYSQNVYVDNTRTYTLSLYIKTENLSSGTPGNARIQFQYFKEGGATTGSMTTPITLSGTNDWQEYKFDVQSFNTDTAYIRIYCTIAKSVGTAWFDDVSFVLDDNLIKNPGFESGNSNWTRDGSEASDDIARTGVNSLKITSVSGEGSSKYGRTADAASIAVEPNKVYTLKAHIKVEGVTDTGTNGAYIRLQHYSGNAATPAWNMFPGADQPYIFKTSGTKDWEEFTYDYTVSANITSVRIYCYLGKEAGGTAWFDDISFIEKVPEIENVITISADTEKWTADTIKGTISSLDFAEKATLIGALYKKDDGVLVDMIWKEYDFLYKGDENFTLNLPVPQEEGYVINLFLFSDFESINPVGNVFRYETQQLQ